MAIAFRAASLRDTGQAANIVVPAGTVADDLIVVKTQTQAASPTLTGFTLQSSLELQSGYYTSTFTRVAAGSEGGNTVACSATAIAFVAASYSGVDPASPISDQASTRANSGGSIASGTVTPAHADCMLVYSCGTWDANGSSQIAAPSGMTRRASTYLDWEPNIIADELLSGGSGVGVTRSTTNPYSSGLPWTCSLIALKPAAGAVTVPDAVDDLAGTAGDTQVVLTWTAPPDGGASITDYVVQYRPIL